MNLVHTISNGAFKILYYAVIVLVVSLALLLSVSAIPIPGNYKVKIVQSGSMEPAITTGSIVLIRPASTYVVGDVITFGRDTRTEIPTTHRIVDVRTQSGVYVYKVKGDANDAPDINEVAHASVIGKVLFDIPYVGYVLDLAKKPVGFVLLVILPALFIIIDEVRSIWAEMKKRQRSIGADAADSIGSSTHVGM